MTIPADALYQHFLITAERRFWRCVQTGGDPASLRASSRRGLRRGRGGPNRRHERIQLMGPSWPASTALRAPRQLSRPRARQGRTQGASCRRIAKLEATAQNMAFAPNDRQVGARVSFDLLDQRDSQCSGLAKSIGAIASALAKAQAEAHQSGEGADRHHPRLELRCEKDQTFRYAALSSGPGHRAARRSAGTRSRPFRRQRSTARPGLIRLTTTASLTLLPANGFHPSGRSARLAKPLRRAEWERRLTYARRYALFTLKVGIAGEDDLDAPGPQSELRRRSKDRPRPKHCGAHANQSRESTAAEQDPIHKPGFRPAGQVKLRPARATLDLEQSSVTLREQLLR